MKFMLIMRSDEPGLEAFKEIPFEQVIEAMGKYNESMIQAGVMRAGEGLTDASEGFVVDFSTATPSVTEGPFGETRELFNGFWIIETASREEAAEWAKRAPLGPGTFLEVRRVTEMEDFPADNEWIQKEEGWRQEQEQEQRAKE